MEENRKNTFSRTKLREQAFCLLYGYSLYKPSDEELDDYYEEEEQRYDRIEEELAKRLKKSTKQELMEMVWDLLYEGPEWQFNRFVDRYLDVD